MRSRFPTVAPILVAFGFVSGCGGGGGIAAGPAETTLDSGSFSFKGQLNPPTMTSSIGASVFVLTGSITKATMTDASPTIDETEILTERLTNLGLQIIATSPDGSNPRVICSPPAASSYLAASSTWVYFGTTGGSIGRAPLAGGSISTIKSGVASFALSPDGTKIAYATSTGDYRVCNADGTGDFLMVNDVSKAYIVQAWLSPTVVAGFSGTTLYRITAATGQSWVSSGTVAGISKLRIHSDSHRAVVATGSEIKSYTVDSSLSLGSIGTLITNTPSTGLGISPDGKHIGNVLSGTNDTITTIPIDCSASSPIGVESNIYSLAWTPFVTSRQFLPAGVFSTGAAALIYSEYGTRVPSVILADATTRGTMVATRTSVDGAVNIVYRLDCDQLTKLYYTKGLNYAQTTVVSSGSGLKGAYVSIDASSGAVSSVLTFTRQPSERRIGKSLVLSGGDLQLHQPDGKQARLRDQFVIP